MIEIRDTPEGELRADEDTGSISGLAAVFYRKSNPGTTYMLWDDLQERIMETAFDRALAENDDVRGLFNHDSNFVFGRTAADTLELSKGKRGLQYNGTPPDTEWVRGLRESIKRGDIDGSSFQFRVPVGTDVFREEGKIVVREIHTVDLIDVGPVTFPAYTASTTKARSELRSIVDEFKSQARTRSRKQRERGVHVIRMAGDRFKPISS